MTEQEEGQRSIPEPFREETAQEKEATTAKDRFCGFAMGHLLFSISTVFFLLPIFSFESEGLWAALVIVLQLAYFPLGILVAWLHEWTAPASDKEKAQAVLWPTLVAWGWVLVVFAALYSEVEEFFLMVFGISMIFALPSGLFSIFSLMFLGGPFGLGGLFLGGILSGCLPPLLFALGSFWQGRRKERRVASA